MGEKMRTKVEKKNKFMNFMSYVTLPIRVLGKAKDLYTKTMFDCAGRICEGSMVVGCTALPPQVSHLPGNFSGNSSKESNDMEDLKELIKVMSLRRNISGIIAKPEIGGRRVAAEGDGGGGGVARRCYSVGVGRIGRIDEDLPCEFVEVDVKKDVFPRCRSYAITKRDVGIFV